MSRRFFHVTKRSLAASTTDSIPNNQSDPPLPQTQSSSFLAESPAYVQTSPSISNPLAQKLRLTSFRTTETYVAFSVASSLWDVFKQQAAYNITEETSIYDRSDVRKTAEGEDLGVSTAASPFWHTTLQLPPTFSTWYQVAFIHMYIVTVRLRVLDRESYSIYMQHLTNQFSYGAEDNMTQLHGMEISSLRNKYKRDLFLQWRGVLAAYDEGLIKGDAVLASAVWRNLWKGQADVDWAKVAMVVEYIRKAIDLYGKASDENILFAVTGDDPEGVPLTEEELKTDGRRKGLFDHVQDGIIEEAKKQLRRNKGITEPFEIERSR